MCFIKTEEVKTHDDVINAEIEQEHAIRNANAQAAASIPTTLEKDKIINEVVETVFK